MSKIRKTGSFSPKLGERGSPTCSSKKRLTFLLSKCLDMQLNVSATRRKIIKISCASTRRLRLMDTELNKGPSEYRIIKKPVSARVKDLSPASEIHKKIVSLLEPVPRPEKFALTRSPCQKVEAEYKVNLISAEELNHPEARELLKLNKRNFGQHFNIDQMGRGSSASPKVVSPLGKPQVLNGYFSKSIRKVERSELMRAYLKEKNDIGGRVLMQKFMHENVRKA